MYYLLLQHLHKVLLYLLQASAMLATALHTPPSGGPHPGDEAGFRYNSTGLAEQDSLVEKGHQVHVSLKAPLPARDSQQEVAPRKMWLGHDPRTVLFIM